MDDYHSRTPNPAAMSVSAFYLKDTILEDSKQYTSTAAEFGCRHVGKSTGLEPDNLESRVILFQVLEHHGMCIGNFDLPAIPRIPPQFLGGLLVSQTP